MKNFFLFKWFRDTSIAKKLYFTMGIMALLIAIELLTLWFAVDTLSSVRAYVGGEGLWSKAQKDAIYHLEKYGHTQNEADYKSFMNFMQVPLGDHRARIELGKQFPDFDTVRQGFIEGRNHPSDVKGMSKLFRRFSHISYIEKAIVIWSSADSMSTKLIPIGQRLHNEIISGSPSQEKINEILKEIGPINSELTKLEDDFSYTLGEGSRWLENLILTILFVIALTVEISGLTLTISVSRGIQKGLNEIITLSAEVAKGNFSVRAKKRSKDEIGVLADAFNRMVDELEHHISERKQSRELLKESEERFRLMVENIKDYSIVMMDPNAIIISWNDGAEPRNENVYDELTGKHFSVYFTDEDVRNGIPEQNISVAKEKGHCQDEGWRKRRNGILFWADVLLTALHDDEGNLRGYAILMRDVTERKMAETTIRQSQAQLSMAQQLAHIGSWEWDLVNNSIGWSEELYRIYGLEPGADTIDPEKINSLTHPADQEMITAVVSESRKSGKPFTFYHRIIRPDNAVRTLHTRGEIITDEKGKQLKMIGTDQDVTDRFREEEMEKLVMAATKSNNSVIIADNSGKIEWVNEGFTRLTGFTLDEVKNTNGELLRQGGATGLSKGTDVYETVVNQKKSMVYEAKNFTRFGEAYWVITTLTPVINDKGKVDRIIAIDSDITERKRIEEDLILANKIAEHSLKKGNKALNELMNAKKELEESMHVKEQFLAKMSHEIRTPMNAIVGLTEILLDTNISMEQKECIDAIKLSSDNLLSIINDILDFSKLESGNVSIESIPFNLKEVIEGVGATLGLSALRKGIKMNYSFDAKQFPEFLVGDSIRLRQILLNLVSNSIKFTEKGSVDVIVKFISENADSCTLEFIIRDTGIGIPENRISTIFDSFTQASNETSRKYGGTGLGLTIVKQLTELQGGSVSVESKINEGSLFTIRLPFKKYHGEEAPETTNEKEAAAEISGPVHVLLAEDNEMNQMLAQKIFNKWKFNLDIAENGKQAVEKLEVADYDIVLMDIQMPLMDGYEATHHIRQKMRSPKSEVPIIALTAHAILGEAEKCLALGMDDYLSKPFNQQTLYDKISALLIKKRAMAPIVDPMEIDNTNGSKETIDLTYLDQIAEGNQDFIKKMINAFINQTPVMMQDMQKALLNKNWKDLRGVAHKMKPSLDFIGLHSIKETVKDMERFSAEEKNLDQIPEMVTRVNKVCNAALEELKQELVKMS